MDPDQTVPRRAVRFGSKLFNTKTSYGQTNIANLVQATPRIIALYGSTLLTTKTAYGSLCQGNATYAYVNGQYLHTDKHLGPESDCSYEIWVNIDCFKDVFQ